MSIEILTVLFFGSLVVFLMLGVPVVFVLGGISVIFLYFTWGPHAFYIVASRMWTTMNNFTLIAIPLYILMAMILERSGVAQRLYHMMHLWWGGIRGGLAIGTIFICAIFGAMVGISGAAVTAMGTIALPAMLKRGYDKELVLGAINTGGGWGVLLPPSILMVLYSLITGVSVGQLFAAGVGPGILLIIMAAIYIAVRCHLQPHLGPPLPPEERGDWSEKLAALRAVILPILIVFFVLGSIFAGLATPTEAAAIGVFGALMTSFVNRQFSWSMLGEASLRTFRLTAMIMWILFAAHAFSTAYTAMGAQSFITELMNYVPGGKWGALIAIMVILFLLAMVLDPVGIMLITLPVFMPLVAMHGFDPIWFGILFIIMMEIGYMTPPFGFNLFYLKGVAPPDVTMGDIYRSIVPYTIVELVGLAIIIMFPAIALWLPSMLF
ncbi:TRAP transporter large permease subunit [Aliihoeflea aestuarii]|uniref:TRAP transporter large permease n=1 Tax=Aliihoeflea aestuarii TaxID=453840 RepID=UPI002093E2A7|nr:TRAP transporter large permease subunit [Aliihoeflea aestuarii]MCO6389630.1 TRAP transporter large permease subunit [Aliihoeflea aestuarii]